MLKKTVTYKDFNDVERTKTLRFNITKTRLADNLHLKDEFEKINAIFAGGARELTLDEVKMMLNLVKEFMRLSYGELSEDGEHFKQTDELYETFTQTAVYDAFLYSLFEDPEKGIEFLVGVLPPDLIKAAEKQLAGGDTVKLSGEPVPVLENSKAEAPVAPTPDDVQQIYTRDQLLEMPQEEFDRRFGTEPTLWSMNVMQAAFARKDQAKQ